MPPIEFILGLILGLVSLGLVVAVLMQPGKDKRLSGAIAGGADTFMAKGKAGKMDQFLGKLTVVLCVLFFVVILALYCLVAAQ